MSTIQLDVGTYLIKHCQQVLADTLDCIPRETDCNGIRFIIRKNLKIKFLLSVVTYWSHLFKPNKRDSLR